MKVLLILAIAIGLLNTFMLVRVMVRQDDAERQTVKAFVDLRKRLHISETPPMPF